MVIDILWQFHRYEERYYYTHSGSQAMLKLNGVIYRLSDPLIFQS